MIIKPKHFKYLYIQRGEVSDAYRGGFDAWQRAYEQSLEALVGNMDRALPQDCSAVLDVGGGLGGLGIVLGRRYPTAGYWVLDGADGRPEVRRHSEPFSNAAVGADFLRANGLTKFGFYAPCDKLDRKFDLVVSTAAWCFHIPPDEYLDRVRNALLPNATIILDVRRRRRDWISQLTDAFGNPEVLDHGKKHVRLAWQT